MLEHVPVDGVDLFCGVHGDGPPLVLLHGFSGNHLSWWQQVPAFEGSYRCLAPDQRGFGLSADAPEGPGASAFVDDLEAVLDRVAGAAADGRVALVGHSMSGWTAAAFATRYPDRVAALVLSGTPAGLLPRERHEAILAEVGEVPDPDPDPLDPGRAFLSESIAELNRHAPPSFEEVHPVVERFETDPDRLADVPTLAIAGEFDPFMPPRAVEALADRLADVSTVTVEGAAHSANYERPGAFDEVVGTFLEKRAAF
ncbi:MAG: alpha/beta hydrolase [Haloarculaceae archaeon]